MGVAAQPEPGGEDEGFAAHRLPSGRHRLSAEAVAANQRWRLLGAASEIFAEAGWSGFTPKRICRRAAVSSSAFYQHFENLSDCLRAVFAVATESILTVVSSACEESASELERVEAALAAILVFCESERSLTALLSIEFAAGLPQIASERELLIARLAARIRAGSAAREALAPPGSREPLVAATVAVVCSRSAARALHDPPGLATELGSLLTIAAPG